jgi:hypothetical protein
VERVAGKAAPSLKCSGPVADVPTVDPIGRHALLRTALSFLTNFTA